MAGAALLLWWAPPGGAGMDSPAATLMQERYAMSTDLSGLSGAWTRLEGAPCGAPYPASLRFEANGLYYGEADHPGAFTIWDVGTWRLEGPGRLALSTANDAVISYDAKLSGDVLTITAPDGCELRYRHTA
jgi:hypothetical protein